MTIKEALQEATKILDSAKEAKIIMKSVLNCDDSELILQEDKELFWKNTFYEKVMKRLKNVPLEYLTNRVSFYSKDFFIEEGVLIPRPETEILVEKTIQIIQTLKNPKVAEIGIGSGVISTILLLELPNLNIVATDINEVAIKLAKRNAKFHFVEDRIKFAKTSLLDGIKTKFDVIISNPPYIANDYPLEKQVLKEPKNALFGGEKGDEILKKIINLARKNGTEYLICEMGYDQKESMKKALDGFEFKFYKDYSGHDRGFVARREHAKTDY